MTDTLAMAKKAKGLYAKVAHVPMFHKTSIGRNPSKAKMNKTAGVVLKIPWPRPLTNIPKYPSLWV